MTYVEMLPMLQRAASRWTPELIVDKENEKAVRSILAWLCGHPEFDGDLGKGLLLIGHRGSGKTLLMRALSLMASSGDMKFGVTNTRKVTSGYNKEGDAGIEQYCGRGNMMFDDLGDERTGQHYGDKVEVMSLVIQDRYEQFTGSGSMTHFTTNLTPNEIRERYGERVYSRLKHMVNIIQVGADTGAVDRRNDAPAPKRKFPQREEVKTASPEVAAEGFRKIREAIAKTKQAYETPMRVVQTRESDLEGFRDTANGASTEELYKFRDQVGKTNTQEAAKPYFDIIDEVIKEREEKNRTA